ncbi:hypothetical protein chiPu_0004432 [Chiloscyllium punctatum]|uniref:Uncharacterized protein n=1 Tax=Chiloscyllium punctatum TaxID=137246 RepID=A0A401S6L5_CHIPU|nr:hypothetical protein [Chiloscyllium punctatum]
MEDGLFYVANKEIGIAGAYMGAHGYPFSLEEVGGFEGEIVKGEDQFSQTNDSVSGRILLGTLGEEETECLEALVMAYRGVEGLDVHDEDEALGAGKRKSWRRWRAWVVSRAYVGSSRTGGIDR